MRGTTEHDLALAHEALEDAALAVTRALLREWGHWVREGRVAPGAPVGTIGAALRRSDPEHPPTAAISDDEALVIERAVAQLRTRRRRVARALITYYTGRNVSHYRLGKLLGTSKGSAQALLSAGEHWVDAWIHARADGIDIG